MRQHNDELAEYYEIIKKVCVIVDVHVHVCTSLVSRLFLVERGNEPGDEALCVYQLQVLPAKEQESSVTYFMCMMKFNYPDAIMERSHFALSLPTHIPTTPHSSNPGGEGRKCLSSAM